MNPNETTQILNGTGTTATTTISSPTLILTGFNFTSVSPTKISVPEEEVLEEDHLTLSGNGGGLLSDTDNFVLQLTFLVILSLVCGLFGTVTNIINIIIFIKQGLFSGGSTLNLFFLAIDDLGVCFLLFLHGIGFSVISAQIPNLPIQPFSIIYLSIGWPRTIFTVINRILTAYVAFERCMCVVIPFRVKNIFAPRRTLIYLIAIFAYGIFSHTPVYLIHRIGSVEREGTNTTQLDLIFKSNRDFWHDLVYYGNRMALGVITALVVIVCTVITTAYVKTSKEWRMKASTASNTSTIHTTDKTVTSDVASSTNYDASKSTKTNSATGNEKSEKKWTKSAMDKEARLVKMITVISVIFCICYIPEVALVVVRSVDERINTGGQYERLSHNLYAVTFVAAAVNSSINIFVYYRMSSKFRQIFLSFLGKNDEKV